MRTLKIFLLITCFGFLFYFSSNLDVLGVNEGQKHMKENSDNLTYPYNVTDIRKKQILDGYELVKSGVTLEDVIDILGKPDEVHRLFSSMSSKNEIGYTHWYIIQRKKAEGSFAEKDEHLVRITYDLNNMVIRKDKW